MSKAQHFNYNRLKNARLSRALTITALSKKIGVSKQAISRIENGNSQPSLVLLEKLIAELKVPSNYFFTNRAILDFNTIFYRSLSATTKRKRNQAEAKFYWFKEIVLYLTEYFDLLPVNFPNFEIKSFDNLNTNLIIEAAQKCRSHWNLGDGPISNITRLLEKNGAIIGKINIEARDVDAISEWTKDKRPYILLGNTNTSPGRMRFNFAHELGHLVLHRDIKREKFKEYHKKIEEQANLFAGHFLMPKKSFSSELYSTTLNSFLSLKQRWLVSVKAMIVHAKKLNLLNEEKYRNLMINYSRKQWGTNGEPMDDIIPTEKPEYLKKCFEILINENILETEEILQQLAFSSNDVEELVFLEPDFFSSRKTEFQPLLKRHNLGNDLADITKVHPN